MTDTNKVKIYLDRFITNNPDLELSEIITDITAGKDNLGITYVRLTTVDKYVYIEANGSISTSEYTGNIITIRPIITTTEGELEETDFDAYLAHPDYYYINLVVSDVSWSKAVVSTLKYEYFVTYVPYELVNNYDVLQDPELIEIAYDEEE
jgi:hypothetical protein